MTSRRVAEKQTGKPLWLKQRLPSGSEHEKFNSRINTANIHTVCQTAQCPNIYKCFSRKTATFMIMGDRCTRNCKFCAVARGPKNLPDPEEPVRIAKMIRDLDLDYVVITSVTRDDLPDGGAFIFVRTVKEIRKRVPQTRIELLIPDFQGNKDALKHIVDVQPNVLNHNIETVPRLYATVRPEAIYSRSLNLIKQITNYHPGVITKSGLMLGLGEISKEIHDTLKDLLEAGCQLLTLGQYLRPTKAHLPVERYVPPKEFDHWRKTALKMGFAEVASGPFVRSSYNAKTLYQAVKPFTPYLTDS